MDGQSTGREPPSVAVRHILRTYVWNERALKALVVVSPTLVLSAGSIVTGLSIDHRLAKLSDQRSAIARDIGQLDQFTKDFESKELQRTSFLAALGAANADMKLRFTLDQIYRYSARGSLRRIAAALDPSGWAARMDSYDAILAAEPGQPGNVAKLQAADSDVIGTALARITALQVSGDDLADRIERLEWRKAMIQMVCNAAMYVLTVLVFFWKTAD